MYMGVLTVCLCPVHMPGARGGQKTGSNLDLELQTRHESSLWFWVVKPGISGRAANGLSHGTITPAPNVMLYLDLSIF